MPIDPTLHTDWAAGIARGIAGRDADAAEELVSVAYLKLCECAKRFEPRPSYGEGESESGHFRGFAHRTIQGECLREMRRLVSGGLYPPGADDPPEVEPIPARLTTEDGEEWASGEDDGARADAADELAELCRAAGLSAAEEEVAFLRLGLERSVAEVAEALGVSADSVRQMEAAALAKLQAAAGVGEALKQAA